MKRLLAAALAAAIAFAPALALAAPPQPAYVTGSPTTGAIATASGPQSFTTGDVSGDCTTSGSLAITCTKTGGTAFGTFATQSYATPPAIGATTPNTGKFTTLTATGNLTTNVTGSTQCLQANSSGVVSGTGSACGSGGGSSGRIDFMPVIQNQTTLTAAANNADGGGYWLHAGDTITGVTAMVDAGGYSGNVILGVYVGGSLVASSGLVSVSGGAFSVMVVSLGSTYTVASSTAYDIVLWHANSINYRIVPGQTFAKALGSISSLPSTEPSWTFSNTGLPIIPRGSFQ